MIYADRRFTLGHGRLFALYVAGYCIGRFGVELLRDDTATHIAGIRINSFTSTFVFIGAVVYIMVAPKGREAPESLRGTDHVDEESPEPEPEHEPESGAADEAATVASAEATTAEAPVSAGEDDKPADSAETVEAAEVADADSEEPETAKLDAVEPEPQPSRSASRTSPRPRPRNRKPKRPQPSRRPRSPRPTRPRPTEPETTEPETTEPETTEPEGVEPVAETESDAEADGQPRGRHGRKASMPSPTKSAEETSTGTDDKATRRRWTLRLRNRR